MGDHPLWSIGDAVTEDAEGRLRAIDAGEGPQSMQNATGVAFLTALSAVIKVTAVIDDAPNMMPALANADLPQAALHDMLRGAVYMSLMIASSTAATLLGLEVRKLISTLIGNASIRTSEGVFWTAGRMERALAAILLAACTLFVSVRWWFERALETVEERRRQEAIRPLMGSTALLLPLLRPFLSLVVFFLLHNGS